MGAALLNGTDARRAHTHTPMYLLRAVTPQPRSTARTLGISRLTRFRFPPWKNRRMIRAQPERQKPHLKAQSRFQAVLLHCTFIFFSDLPPQPRGEGTDQLLQEPSGSPAGAAGRGAGLSEEATGPRAAPEPPPRASPPAGAASCPASHLGRRTGLSISSLPAQKLIPALSQPADG